MPARFAVAPAGQATANATLEGLTVSPDGRQVVAAMEGTLSGDVAADGTDTLPPVPRLRPGPARAVARCPGRPPTRSIPATGSRRCSVYRDGRLLVMEAAFDPATGNTVELYAVPGLRPGRDVSRVGNLSTRPGLVMAKRLVADVTACPTLGATREAAADQPADGQLRGTHHPSGCVGPTYGVTLISDDNFGATQITRVLSLVAVLP